MFQFSVRLFLLKLDSVREINSWECRLSFLVLFFNIKCNSFPWLEASWEFLKAFYILNKYSWIHPLQWFQSAYKGHGKEFIEIFSSFLKLSLLPLWVNWNWLVQNYQATPILFLVSCFGSSWGCKRPLKVVLSNLIQSLGHGWLANLIAQTNLKKRQHQFIDERVGHCECLLQ